MQKALSAIAIAIGLAALLTFHLTGSTVDANGMLKEPFPLLPIGLLLLAAGISGLVVSMVRVRSSKPKPPTIH
jgi:hypothetical protein